MHVYLHTYIPEMRMLLQTDVFPQTVSLSVWSILNKLYRRAAAMICPRPGLQRMRAAAALSQAAQAGPDQPIRAIRPAAHAARRPDVRDRRQTDRRQTASSLNAPGRGHKN